jgi:hypothetical protein
MDGIFASRLDAGLLLFACDMIEHASTKYLNGGTMLPNKGELRRRRHDAQMIEPFLFVKRHIHLAHHARASPSAAAELNLIALTTRPLEVTLLT